MVQPEASSKPFLMEMLEAGKRGGVRQLLVLVRYAVFMRN